MINSLNIQGWSFIMFLVCKLAYVSWYNIFIPKESMRNLFPHVLALACLLVLLMFWICLGSHIGETSINLKERKWEQEMAPMSDCLTSVRITSLPAMTLAETPSYNHLQNLNSQRLAQTLFSLCTQAFYWCLRRLV